MASYYHVAHVSYQPGDALWCRNELEIMGAAPPWQWEDADEGFDGDVVCLFRAQAEATDFIAELCPNGRLLAVDLPDDLEAYGLRLTRVDEGYPAVYGHIPAEYITPLCATEA